MKGPLEVAKRPEDNYSSVASWKILSSSIKKGHRCGWPFFEIWLRTVDTLRNLLYAPTVEMKITFELLRQGSLAG